MLFKKSWESSQKAIITSSGYNYLLFLPAGYETRQRWPLILFLHGAGERGDTIYSVKTHGIPKIAEERTNFPFMAVSPQCPKNQYWSNERLIPLLDEIESSYRVDPAGIYLTGMSMGGYGTWNLAIAQPKRFAAIAPVCGGGNPGRVCVLKDTPVWVFHGAKDRIVPIYESEKMVAALKRCGGNPKFTIYPEAEHDSWTETYENPKLYDWFLKHRLEPE